MSTVPVKPPTPGVGAPPAPEPSPPSGSQNGPGTGAKSAKPVVPGPAATSAGSAGVAPAALVASVRSKTAVGVSDGKPRPTAAPAAGSAAASAVRSESPTFSSHPSLIGIERPMAPERYGKYNLLERIGVGGMAEVWRAKTLGAEGFTKDLVIKRILPKFTGDEESVRMFIDEARLVAKMHHPNIVQIFDFD
ncbi:MAG: hypothetical protein KA244_02075, partial [Deltaproteobacteria bacterium]|nr:hypothetical protein [Deltaproteobacteria bacterium]